MKAPESQIQLTLSELQIAKTLPGVLEALADYHDWQESEAASIDPEVFAAAISYHNRRRKELRAEAARIKAEWEKF